jgi:hypothetical protein
VSPHSDRLILKGGMLLAALDQRRPTRDVDLLAAAVASDTETIAGPVRGSPASTSTTGSCSTPVG